VPTREPSLPELAEDFRDMRDEMRRGFEHIADMLERKFLPRELYDANRRADRAEVAHLAEQVGGFRSGWRAVLVNGVLPIVVGVILALLGLILARGGV
jgi:hypothetical protein